MEFTAADIYFIINYYIGMNIAVAKSFIHLKFQINISVDFNFFIVNCRLVNFKDINFKINIFLIPNKYHIEHYCD